MSDDTNRRAPVLPLDFDAVGHVIWPCHGCLPWHAEVVMTEDLGLVVREWHAVGCFVLHDESDT